MSKMTLLEIVQDILSDLDSDEVNSINDTTEALQVAQTVKTTYNNIIDGKEWPWLFGLFTLQASGTVARPTHMQLPETIIDVEWVKYNIKSVTDTKSKYTTLEYRTPSEFLDLIEDRNSASTIVTVVTDLSGTPLNIINNKAPQWYTSFDDEFLVFDSYNIAIDTTLQTAKTQCYGKRSPVFTISNTFIPDMPVQMFSYLLNESKSTCFLNLKQAPNAKAEQHSVSQRRRMSQEAWRIKNGITYPHYGRK